jgi:hypothetical protein
MGLTGSRYVVLIGALAIVLSACTSASDGVGASGGAPTDAAPVATPAGGAPTDAAPAGSGLLDSFKDEGSSAVVTIDGQRYEWTDLYCVTLGGAMGVASIDDDPSVNIDIPPEGWETSGEGWEPPSVTVRGDEPYFNYVAGDETITGGNPGVKVDSVTTDGFRATGSATFLDLDSPDAQTLTGTFEVTCPKP